MNQQTQFDYEPWQEEEIRKCSMSYSYFCENYVKIIHPVKGMIPFQLYDFQKRVVSEYDQHQFNIIKKFRQAGLTTVSVIWALWRCLFKFEQRIMVLSKSDREAIGVGKIVKNVLENMPPWMAPVMNNNNDHEKEFTDTRSILWFYTCAAARSKALTYLIIDEAAFIPNMDEHWKAMYPTLSTGGNCICISTVNGMGNWYEETWHRAQDRKNQFHIINLEYTEHPDYRTVEWERKMRANLGEKGWLQEIMGSFLGSGETYIDSRILAELEKSCIDPVDKMFPEWDTTPADEFDEDELANPDYVKGALWLWKEPQPGHEYILSADAAEGVRADNSAFHIIDTVTFEQVAEFYSNEIPVHKFAMVTAQMATFFNEALLVMDHDTGPGMAVLNRLEHTIHYPNLYWEAKKGRSDKSGLTLSRTSRPLVLETMQTCLLNKLIRIRSRRLIRELKNFAYNKQKQRPEAVKNKTDDLVLALAIGLHVTDIANRDLPVGAEPMNGRIGKALTGKSFEDVKNQIRDGLPDDFFDAFDTDDSVDFYEILPRSVKRDHHRRPGDSILKEFGW